MIKLFVNGWSRESAWMSDDRWSHFDYCQRLAYCTYLRGVALDSAATALLKKERIALELVSRKRAEALLFTLDSLGAQAEIKQLRTQKVVSLELFRQSAGERTPRRSVAGAR
ncbi:MAG: hypothetical protein AB2598_13925 [Candidatus Thiodiazotropha sp.]